jgi:putative heme-binding domain-containing protein
LLQPFLSRQKGTETLATALAAKPPSADGAKLALQALGALGRDEPKLREVLYKAAGLLVTEPPAYSAELVAKLIAEAKSKGNARNGKALFSAQVTACNACHKIGNEGGTLGPDLSAIGRGMTPELIVESVLWPKRQIKEGFFLTSVTLADGSQQQGYIHSESATELVLRDPATGVETRLRKSAIKERADSGTLMPEGLTAALTGEQVRDLLRYLMELGR